MYDVFAQESVTPLTKGIATPIASELCKQVYGNELNAWMLYNTSTGFSSTLCEYEMLTNDCSLSHSSLRCVLQV